MLWTHAVLLFWACNPPPCQAADLDRFPRTLWVEHDPYVVWTGPRLFREGSTRTCHYIDWTSGAKERLNWLENQRAACRPDYWQEWDNQISEQEAILEAWRYLNCAWRERCEYNCDHDVIAYLRLLRDMIGEDAYASGRMPNPIPTHRYAEVPR